VRSPIAVIAFNRPDYLRATLESLAAQRGFRVGPIALFQDGLVNRFSGKCYGSDEIVAEQMTVFRSYFPEGDVFIAQENLGPALNIARAEEWAFVQCGADVAYFFEDDMVLSPYYLTSLKKMLNATENDERVGYCACYGPLWPAPAAPANAYVPMHMNWAFALRRRQWEKSKPYVDSYMNLLRGSDYRDRPMGKIMRLREQWGAPGPYTTQDVIRTLACRLTGGIKLNTRATLARYIGARGLHIDQLAYDAAGFARVELFPHALDGFGPVDEKTFLWCCEVHDRFAGTAGEKRYA
jgi:hypothetical protein